MTFLGLNAQNSPLLHFCSLPPPEFMAGSWLMQRMLGLGSGTSVGDGLFRHRRAGQMIGGARLTPLPFASRRMTSL
jgi:hypothetical protein